MLVCVGSISNIEQRILCGEDSAFLECKCILLKALVNLIAAYYVYDVKYPQCMIWVLSFLLLQKETQFKGQNMLSLWQSLKRAVAEIEKWQ